MSIYQKSSSYIAECIKCDRLFDVERGQTLTCPHCGTDYIVEERTHMDPAVFEEFQRHRERFNDAELSKMLQELSTPDDSP